MRVKVTDWITSNNLMVLKGWAREGLTDEQIARKIGITRRTLCNWKNYSVQKEDGTRIRPIEKALKDGKEVIDYAVENALLQQAMSGNITAIIFWLKNRRPDVWRDRQNQFDEEVEPVKVIIDV